MDEYYGIRLMIGSIIGAVALVWESFNPKGLRLWRGLGLLVILFAAFFVGVLCGELGMGCLVK